MSKDTGGPAFPVSADVAGFQGMTGDISGMTLRDYFAAKAIQTLMSIELATIDDAQPDETAEQWIARKAYAMADTMLAERSKP